MLHVDTQGKKVMLVNGIKLTIWETRFSTLTYFLHAKNGFLRCACRPYCQRMIASCLMVVKALISRTEHFVLDRTFARGLY